jgi:hypothetical protein
MPRRRAHFRRRASGGVPGRDPPDSEDKEAQKVEQSPESPTVTSEVATVGFGAASLRSTRRRS